MYRPQAEDQSWKQKQQYEEYFSIVHGEPPGKMKENRKKPALTAPPLRLHKQRRCNRLSLLVEFRRVAPSSTLVINLILWEYLGHTSQRSQEVFPAFAFPFEALTLHSLWLIVPPANVHPGIVICQYRGTLRHPATAKHAAEATSELRPENGAQGQEKVIQATHYRD